MWNVETRNPDNNWVVVTYGTSAVMPVFGVALGVLNHAWNIRQAVQYLPYMADVTSRSCSIFQTKASFDIAYYGEI